VRAINRQTAAAAAVVHQRNVLADDERKHRVYCIVGYKTTVSAWPVPAHDQFPRWPPTSAPS